MDGAFAEGWAKLPIELRNKMLAHAPMSERRPRIYEDCQIHGLMRDYLKHRLAGHGANRVSPAPPGPLEADPALRILCDATARQRK